MLKIKLDQDLISFPDPEPHPHKMLDPDRTVNPPAPYLGFLGRYGTVIRLSGFTSFSRKKVDRREREKS